MDKEIKLQKNSNKILESSDVFSLFVAGSESQYILVKSLASDLAKIVMKNANCFFLGSLILFVSTNRESRVDFVKIVDNTDITTQTSILTENTDELYSISFDRLEDSSVNFTRLPSEELSRVTVSLKDFSVLRDLNNSFINAQAYGKRLENINKKLEEQNKVLQDSNSGVNTGNGLTSNNQVSTISSTQEDQLIQSMNQEQIKEYIQRMILFETKIKSEIITQTTLIETIRRRILGLP